MKHSTVESLGTDTVQIDEGTRSRSRRSRTPAPWLTAGLVGVTAAAMPLALITVTSALGPGDGNASAAANIAWAQVEAPWVDQTSVHFGRASTPRPQALLTLGHAGTTAYWQTPDGAGGGELHVWQPGAGDPRRVATGLQGLAAADPAGQVVSWTTAGRDAESTQVHLLHTASGRIDTATVVGDRMRVFAVDRQTVYISNGNDVHLRWAGGAAPVQQHRLAGDSEGIVTDADSGWTLEIGAAGTSLVTAAGERVLSDRPLFGTFSPNREYIALVGENRPSVQTTRINASATPLNLPADMIFDSARWTGDNQLLVRGAVPANGLDDIATTPGVAVSDYLCSPADGSCSKLPSRELSLGAAEGAPPNAAGQFATIVN